MFWRRAMSAAGALALLAAASWLPARASGTPPDSPIAAADLARPALKPPASWPTHPAGPVEAVGAFLWSLSGAVGGTVSAPAPGASDTSTSTAAPAPAVGDATAQPFARAYGYLAAEWQARLPFEAFLRTWATVRQLEPLAIIAAGAPPGGDPRSVRVFAEVRMLTVQPGRPGYVSLSFADGFYLAMPSPQGWYLASGALRVEDFGLQRTSGASPGPEAAAEQAARTTATRLGRPGAAGPAQVRVEPRPDHQAVATVRLGEDTYNVRVYQLADAQWVALSAQR